jgi:Uncharacterized protein conserved in bacteria (DUF2125)
MFHAKTFAAAGLVASLMGGTAQAALTADQVWANWQESATSIGLALAAESKTSDVGILTLTGVTVRPTIPQSDADPEGAIDTITMAGAADGSVVITFAPEFTVPLTMLGKDDQITVTHDGLTVTAKEAGGGLTYDYAAPNVKLEAAATYRAPALDGSGDQDASFDLSLDFVNLAGNFADTPGANRKITVSQKSDMWTYTLKQVDPTTSSTSNQTSEMADVTLGLDMTMPSTLRLGDIASGADFTRALNEGLAAKIDIAQGITTQTGDATNPYLNYAIKSTSQPGTVGFTVDKTGGQVTAASAGATFEVTSPMFPFPALTASLGALAMDVRLPLTGGAAQPFRYMVKMENLSVNDEAWAVVDPGKVLPRDPATIALDLTGNASMDLGAVMDSGDTGGDPDPMPSIDALNIADLKLAVAGALMTGKGAFTFDNSTGVPVPSGSADISLTGGNALIDGLVAIGVVPEDQAASARMMMSMFMSPGDGADTMTSKVEARDDGGIYVNGQRVQ